MGTTITGTPLDRLSGLEALLLRADGLSVLDIGCHKGFVALAFANAGAADIHAFDFFAPHVEIAKAILGEFKPPARVFQHDLASGILPGSQPRQFDIVLYLGVHHHLEKVMDEKRLTALFDQIVNAAGRYLAIRTTLALLDKMGPRAAAAGLRLVHFSDMNEVVSPLHIYERPQGHAGR